jgi:hypothetical protein
LSLGGVHLVEQAALLDGFLLDPPSFFDDGICPAEVSVGRRDIAKALVAAPVVVVLDEVTDGVIEGAWQIVVLEQASVLQGLAPAFDLALRLGAPRT